ncbi:glycosyltransferase family 1 protein [Halomonas piscis]|uniref:Glycosyltransferase family 1 protein n=1 Tax=Halomonas piscis TaxID=3031727 RepID=A0ABY9Z215_9GAMM|nr:glycosyltransferase family 1 protein [Halomonas piscis]WNK20263.1 glycosyltransferase family 1 protein [Halomonas piscis]
MRICLVSETWPPDINGVAHTLNHLADQLHDRGIALQLVRPQPRQGWYQERHPGIRAELLVRGLALPGYREVRLGLPAPRRLKRLWQDQRPDVVYLATQGPLGWSARSVARRLGIPVVAGWHTNFDHYCHDYHLPWVAPAVLSVLRRFHNGCAATLVPTHALAARLAEQGFQNLEVMGRGIDGERFSPHHRDSLLREQWGVGEHQPVALHVGRLASEKNLALLEESFRTLLEARPDMALVIVGDGPARQRLERALPNAHFTGFVPRESLARHYASADLFLFPSLSETWGNVVLEAMASGLAVVAFRQAAAAELIDHECNGLAIAPNDDAGFRDAVLTLCQQPARYARLGRAARQRALEYRWSAIADTFLTVLQQARESTHETAHPCGV